ncbi:MAG: GNAT family N-acetyltransferase [Thermoguttaceae bacterium]|nr:GNAT family N-acetyltransferase [Thermoguttaceae bacterium]
MNYRELPWDSAFFGLPVASMDIDECDTPEMVQDVIDDSAAELIYVFLSPELQPRFEGILPKYGVMYDERVFYEKTLSSPVPKPTLPDGFSFAMIDQPVPELYTLARASSWDSRFAKDPRLAPKVGELYDLWIENGLSAPDCSIIGAYDDRKDRTLRAMVSFKLVEDIGIIELIAVDSHCRHRGIGRTLLALAIDILFQQGGSRVGLRTQKTNPACRLYEFLGFSVGYVRNVWHLYKSTKNQQAPSE